MTKSSITDVEVEYQTHTDRAVCVSAETKSGDDVWLPLSQVETDNLENVVRGDLIVVTLPEWLANERGLI